MKKSTVRVAAFAGLSLSALLSVAGQPVSYTSGTYSQSFDSLSSTVGGTTIPWTNGTTLPGWYAFRRQTNSPGNTTPIDARDAGPFVASTGYLSSDGGSSSGQIFSFGPSGDSNRAFGTLNSGTSGTQSFNVALVNNSATTYNTVDLSFVARQFRNANTVNPTTFITDYKILTATPADAAAEIAAYAGNSENFGAAAGWTQLTNLQWATTVSANPATSTPAGTTIGTFNDTITGIAWAPGQVLVVRLSSNRPTSTGQGQSGAGIDNFSLTASQQSAASIAYTVTPAPSPLLVVPGDIVYTFSGSNTGTLPANGATISAPVPANVTLVSSTQPGVTLNSGTLNIPLGNVGAGGTFNFTVTLAPQVPFPASAPLAIAFTSAPGGVVRNTSVTAINSSDLAVTISNDLGTTCIPAGPITYTVGLTNNGPANSLGTTVTIPVPETISAGSFVASAGSASVSNGILTWNVGTVNNAATPTLTFVGTPTGQTGGVVVVATAANTSGDIVATNNVATVRNNIPDTTSTPKPVLFTSVDAAVTQEVPAVYGLEAGAVFVTRTGQNVNGFTFGRPFVSGNGTKWAMPVETTSTNGIVIISGDIDAGTGAVTNYGTVARGGVTLFADRNDVPNTAVSPVFDRPIAINDSGEVAYSTRTATAGAQRVVASATRSSGGNFTTSVIARQGNGAGPNFPASANWGATMSVAGILNTGLVNFYAQLANLPVNSINNNSLAQRGTTGDATVLALSSVDVPSGQSGGPFPFNDFGAGTGGNSPWIIDGTSTAANGNRLSWAFINDPPTGTSTNPAANQIITVNNAVVLQEGSVVPGSGFAEAIRTSPAPVSGTPFQYAYMEPDGTWFAYGSNLDPVVPSSFSAGQDWVVRNGAVIARTGDPIFSGSTELWSDSTAARTFIMATGRGSDTVVGGLTNRLDSATRAVLVWNDTTVLLRTGDPVDVNGDGLNNDNAYVSFIRDARATIDASRTLWVVVDLRNGDQVCSQAATDVIGQAVLRLPLPAGGPVACNPADIAQTDNTPGFDGCVNNGDFSLFFSVFFSADCTATCPNLGGTATGPCNPADIAQTDNTPGFDGCVDNGDFSLFFSEFFSAVCPDCAG